eukprot:9211838-Pyramimonas_sp.AAC.1
MPRGSGGLPTCVVGRLQVLAGGVEVEVADDFPPGPHPLRHLPHPLVQQLRQVDVPLKQLGPVL